MQNHWTKYLDPNGLVSTISPGVITHNGIMFTAPYIWWLVTTKPDGYEAELERIKKVFEECWVHNGGFNRAPAGWTKSHLNQNDDYMAIGWIDKMLGTNYSARSLNVARNNRGCLNNTNPGVFSWKSWLFRMPHLKTHLQFAAKETPDPIGISLWIAYMLYSTTKLDKRDSRIKAFMAAKVAEGFSPVTDLAIKAWRAAFRKKYSGYGHAEYFTINHPSREILWDWN